MVTVGNSMKWFSWDSVNSQVKTVWWIWSCPIRKNAFSYDNEQLFTQIRTTEETRKCALSRLGNHQVKTYDLVTGRRWDPIKSPLSIIKSDFCQLKVPLIPVLYVVLPENKTPSVETRPGITFRKLAREDVEAGSSSDRNEINPRKSRHWIGKMMITIWLFNIAMENPL